MSKLNLSYAELYLPEVREKTCRSSVSGVQHKVQLKRIRGGYSVVESGGDYILKPVPRNTAAELAGDMPANEALTMDIAAGLFGIRTAEHAMEMILRFSVRRGAVESAVAGSRLSSVAKQKYLARFFDRLKAISL